MDGNAVLKWLAVIRGFSVLSIIAVCALAIGQWALYTNVDGRFSVTYPSAWHAEKLQSGLTLYNFPASAAIKGVILPASGARITLARQPSGVPTVDAWIRQDLVGSTPEVRRELQPSRSCGKLTEVQWRWEGGPEEYFQEIAFYCTTKGPLYSVQLTYWSNNPNGQDFRTIALHIVRSLKTS
jgi:hypothetical protein